MIELFSTETKPVYIGYNKLAASGMLYLILSLLGAFGN